MAFNDPHRNSPLYPQVSQSNPDSHSPFISHPKTNPSAPPTTSASSNIYPPLDLHDLAENLFPDDIHARNHGPNYPYTGPNTSASAPLEPISYEETLITVPGAIVHLIDKQYSVELAYGDFSVFRLWQGENIVAVLARVGNEVQWPLMKDDATVKVDESHYFFSIQTPKHDVSDSSDEEHDKQKGKSKSKSKSKKETPVTDNTVDMLNYGLSFALKGQEKLLFELDRILAAYSTFSVQSVSEKSKEGVLDGSVTREISPEEMKKSGKKREAMERRCGAYWTTLAPNVEDYSGSAAKVIASGSGYMIKGILWCGDVTVDRLKWGNDVLIKRLDPNEKKTEISPETKKRLKRAKGMTKMTEKVAVGVLSGVVKVSGFITGSVANSKAGKKFFSLLPGEIILASLDGFNKICDAVEVAGRNVMSTSNTVTTRVVTHKYGEEAGKATQDGLGAAGHAFGTAWAAFKVRKALNPKSVVKTSTLAKSAARAVAEDVKKSKKSSK